MRRAALHALAACNAAEGPLTTPVSILLQNTYNLSIEARQAWSREASSSIHTSAAPHSGHGQQRNQSRKAGGSDGSGSHARNQSDRGGGSHQHGGRGRWQSGGGDGGAGGAGGPRGPRRTDSRPAEGAGRAGGVANAAGSALQAQPARQRWDLATQNAPQGYFGLIGDPRTGIADDMTTNPFGEVTVDMIHHQSKNEVYWFKHEFAGGRAGSHRDARLSDYTRNLIYLLRAKDSKRWSIQALADKFRIRKQRVLAILALKELEAQRIEEGKLLSGPLAAYALPVNTAEAQLGRQAEPGQQLGAAEEAHVEAVLPRVLSATQQLQMQLVELLSAHGYDTAHMRAGLLADLQAAEELAGRTLGGSGEAAEGSGAPYLAAELGTYRAAVEAVMAAVEEVVAGSPLLMEERQVAALRAAVEADMAGAGQAGAEQNKGLQALQAADDALMQRVFFSLAPSTRGSLLRLQPDLSIRLNALGVDLIRSAKDASYKGPGTAGPEAAQPAAAEGSFVPLQRLPVDVFGFLPVAEGKLEAVAAAVEALVGAQAAVRAKVAALDPALASSQRAAPSAAAPSASELRQLRQMAAQYAGAEAMWADLMAPRVQEGSRPPRHAAVPADKLRRLLEVMAEADPSAVSRTLQVEAAMQLRARRAVAEADALTAGVGAAAAAALTASGGTAPSTPAERASWDSVAAYLDVKVAGRVYGTGSGERHVARLPSYPAFEGYSLEEFDRATEGELGALNRQVAERTDAAMYERFRSDLLYNLGLRGEKLRHGEAGRPAWPANLNSVLERPVVVYDIAEDGATKYPPLYVAMPDGQKRPLNEQEQVFQERRVPRERLPYYVSRANRLAELQ
ncbi:hypothetical protein Agub_g4180 [Astrephomene gubernaculifera]|uniref:Uncharacterized protein n=1 Tax=Astrephomene gubernaculifera TaxID=47775 RepID=A0AAD3HJP7_9CHLO|nr:hypothetical protein Agub_g4180 [Astrephomene gubernaculifera]